MRETSKSLLRDIKKAVMVTLVLLVLCGLGYPLLLTGVAQVVFPHQANGSLIEVDGQTVGSQLVGQDFTEEYFMKCRPSAVSYNTYTQDQVDSEEYGGVSSGSNNYAPSNPDLVARVEADMAVFLEQNPQLRKEDIPTDLLTASGSGLDPHISPASAAIQLEQLSTASGIAMDRLRTIVAKHTEGKAFGILGESHVNVLAVNIDIAQEMGLLNSTAS